jgi:hypothetical protein
MDRRRQELIDLVYIVETGRAERALNVHRTTLARWMSGKSRIPESALVTLRAYAKGQLPGMTDEHWQGWRFGRDGMLYEPNGYAHSEGDIRAQFYERRLIRAQQDRIQELEAKVKALTTQLASVDTAANDMSIWPGNPQSKVYEA